MDTGASLGRVTHWCRMPYVFHPPGTAWAPAWELPEEMPLLPPMRYDRNAGGKVSTHLFADMFAY